MTKDVITINPDADILQAGQRLTSGQFSCLPVVEAGQLVGMITEIDLLRGFLAAAAPAGELMKVKDYMNQTPYTLGGDDLVITAFQLMHDKHIRHLPILSSDAKLIGIVTDRDIRQEPRWPNTNSLI
jgi:CBS domain-containing protein